ncbi:MAG TPA: hypothetical protein VNN76_01945 [Bacteroidota bacterium]|nr:hypothetical protein [Bacteroidota bacterium]
MLRALAITLASLLIAATGFAQDRVSATQQVSFAVVKTYSPSMIQKAIETKQNRTKTPLNSSPAPRFKVTLETEVEQHRDIAHVSTQRPSAFQKATIITVTD